MEKAGQTLFGITTQVKSHLGRNVLIVAVVVLITAFIFLAPIVPLGGYGVQSNLPHQISVQAIRAICHDTGCPALLTPEGPSYVSVSYVFFGVGEYLFVDQTLHIWAFVR